MSEDRMITMVACITKIPVRKLRLACQVSGNMNNLIRNAHTIQCNLTERQREVLSGLGDIARYIMTEGKGIMP